MGAWIGEILHLEKRAVFPDPRVGLARADFARVAPGVDGKEARRERGSDVHGAAVHADGKGGAAEEPEEFAEGGAVEEVGGVFERRQMGLGATGEDDAMRHERAAELGDLGGGEGFSRAARKWVEEDERLGDAEAGGRGTLWQRPFERQCGFDAEGGDEGEVAGDGVRLGGHVHGLVVEMASAFAGVGEADDATGVGAAEAGDEGAAEESLEIEDEVGFARGDLFRPAGNARPAGGAAELTAGEVDDFIDVRVAVEERRPLGIDEPAEVRVRPAFFDEGDGGEGVDDVAEGAGFEDQDRGGIYDFRFQISDWKQPARGGFKSEI